MNIGSPRTRRRTLAAGAASMLAAALAGCSPVRLLNGLVPDSTYELDRGIAYGPQPRQLLDVYRPLESRVPAPGRRPLIVFFYGGSWTHGERAEYKFVGEALASHGAVAVIPDYRLSPQVTYPVFVQDSAAALQWGIDNAERLGADPKRVYVMGHSAGAYLAAMLALDARWLGALGSSPDRLSGWIGLAGPYDFLPIGDPLTQVAFDWPSTKPSSQPLAHASSASPPALLIAAVNDSLVDPKRNTERMAARLRADGVPVEVREFEGLNHVTLVGAIARPIEWIGGPVLPPVLAFVGLAGVG